MPDELVRAVEQASAHGRTPADYHQVAIKRAIANGDMAAIDLFATDAYYTLATHLVKGRVDPVSVEPY
jgi:hypothetical protein